MSYPFQAAFCLHAKCGMLCDGSFCQDLGADHFRRASPKVQANRLARQITKLDFTCTILAMAEKEVRFRWRMEVATL